MITALIHTRNEERMLPDCLASVRWADEILVADMASTDATRQIAKDKGARILDMPIVPLVDLVRNQAIAEARHDWVLVLDADERASDGLAKRLQAIASQPEAEAYGIPFKTLFLGVWLEHGSWPDHHIRFFRRGAVKWMPYVHEPPTASGKFIYLPPDPDECLIHLAVTNLPSHLEKIARYGRLDAERLLHMRKPPVWPWLVRRPLGEFYGRFFRDQAWRHGMHGLVWSLVLAAYELQVAMNYWALRQNEPPSLTPGRLRRQVRWEAIRSNLKWLRF
jgi:glycosyltransferase involved in cell wall biosynthesis